MFNIFLFGLSDDCCSDSTINYQARHHAIDFVLNPYYGSQNLSFASSQKTLSLRYRNTVLEYDVNRKNTSGLDPQSIREPFLGRLSFPGPLPIVSRHDDRLVLDVEGLVSNKDGSWVSFQYAHDKDIVIIRSQLLAQWRVRSWYIPLLKWWPSFTIRPFAWCCTAQGCNWKSEFYIYHRSGSWPLGKSRSPAVFFDLNISLTIW